MPFALLPPFSHRLYCRKDVQDTLDESDRTREQRKRSYKEIGKMYRHHNHCWRDFLRLWLWHSSWNSRVVGSRDKMMLCLPRTNWM
ncbi:hypothetical protein WG66_010651 [Moniliophthora roreri]|nr:hypothetical protein WG66_010651 [Moniliophthora roreri]